MVKTKLKYVIPTFFTCFAKILASHERTEGSFLLGWSDPRLTLGTEPRAKVGFYKRGCQEKTLLPPQERNQISDIPLRPSDCNTICCVPRTSCCWSLPPAFWHLQAAWWLLGQPWFYLRLEAYRFIGLSEEAYGRS